jgi:hypothetical protein
MCWLLRRSRVLLHHNCARRTTGSLGLTILSVEIAIDNEGISFVKQQLRSVWELTDDTASQYIQRTKRIPSISIGGHNNRLS